MSVSQPRDRGRYPMSVLISLALHGALALVLGLVIVTQRETSRTGFTAEFVAVSKPEARERPLPHRRVPAPVEATETFHVDTRPPLDSPRPEASYGPIAAETTVSGAWTDGSAFVRPWQDLPPARLVVPVRPHTPAGFAPTPAPGLDGGRSLSPRLAARDQALPGLSTLLVGTLTPTGTADPLPEYLEVIQNRIRKYQRYPRFARESGMEGTTTVLFTLERSGRVAEVSALDSSGYKLLDDAATTAIRDASPFPPFPEGQRGDAVRCRIQIVFKLDEGE